MGRNFNQMDKVVKGTLLMKKIKNVMPSVAEA